jgi:hypothetical protein
MILYHYNLGYSRTNKTSWMTLRNIGEGNYE